MLQRIPPVQRSFVHARSLSLFLRSRARRKKVKSTGSSQVSRAPELVVVTIFILALDRRLYATRTLSYLHLPAFAQTPTIGGASDGDPHLRTFDGSRYDCQGQGEFLLAEIAATESEVQVRYQPWGRNPTAGVTMNTAIAAREGSSSVIQATAAALGTGEVLVDGELYDEISSVVTGVALEVTQFRVEMRFPSGLDVFVVFKPGYLNINTYVPLSANTTGLLGNNNGQAGDEWTVSLRSTPNLLGEVHAPLHVRVPVCENEPVFLQCGWDKDHKVRMYVYCLTSGARNIGWALLKLAKRLDGVCRSLMGLLPLSREANITC